MIAEKTKTVKGKTIITDADFDRLSRLADLQQYRATQSHLLAALNAKLRQSHAVPPTQVGDDVVTMHSQVVVHDGRSGDSAVYTLVYPEEVNLDENKLSVLAPLGLALLGGIVGQTIRVDAPAGERRVRVEKILYQPEQAGDFHL